MRYETLVSFNDGASDFLVVHDTRADYVIIYRKLPTHTEATEYDMENRSQRISLVQHLGEIAKERNDRLMEALA